MNQNIDFIHIAAIWPFWNFGFLEVSNKRFSIHNTKKYF